MILAITANKHFVCDKLTTSGNLIAMHAARTPLGAWNEPLTIPPPEILAVLESGVLKTLAQYLEDHKDG